LGLKQASTDFFIQSFFVGVVFVFRLDISSSLMLTGHQRLPLSGGQDPDDDGETREWRDYADLFG
jgi:hypothetical protein